ncbi:MAG: SDR family NAD(P)-dependent oxidoreductase [Candidatus Aminicenantales bacterium]
MKTASRVLEGKVAVVTGAGRGIGRAIASRLARAGARVIAADINFSSAQEIADKLTSQGMHSTACAVDVADEESVRTMVARILKVYDRIDILVNNAGIMFRTRISDISSREWDDTLRVNLTGPFLCIKAVLPAMKKNGFGRIVNISSSAGRSVSTLGGAHYTASKAGLLGLTRAVAKEVSCLCITVNAICPGLIETDMVRKTTTGDEIKAFIASFPIKRMGSPEEVASLVVFLCSEEASYITGASIDINGGDLMI